MRLAAAMKSPLSLEQKVQIGHLFRHDFAEKVAILGNAAMTGRNSTPDKAKALMYHLGSVLETFTLLTVEHDTHLPFVRKSDFDSFGGVFPYLMEKKKAQLSLSVENIPEFNTHLGIVYIAVFNLVKNSFNADWNAQVQIRISPYRGELPETINDDLFLPENARPDNDFVRIAVHDNGPGFPTDRAPTDFLDLGVSTKKDGGFGLFFVKMAAKYLQAPLAIHSEPGNTSVALYHPLNLCYA